MTEPRAGARAPTMAARIAALRTMTTGELRERWLEVFGEEPRSRNKDFLWKRIAWRIQAEEEGDIPERVRRKAALLAQDADVRVRAPRGTFTTAPTTAGARTALRAVGRLGDPRLPVPGTVLTRAYKGRVLRVTVLDDGFEYEGRVYAALSAIANEVTGSRWNGFLFFGLAAPRRAAGGVR
jgi:DUF2924 family protein